MQARSSIQMIPLNAPVNSEAEVGIEDRQLAPLANRSELPRMTKRRSSQNSSSPTLGEQSILKMGEVAGWPNAEAFLFLKVLTPVSRRRGFESLPPLR